MYNHIKDDINSLSNVYRNKVQVTLSIDYLKYKSTQISFKHHLR